METKAELNLSELIEKLKKDVKSVKNEMPKMKNQISESQKKIEELIFGKNALETSLKE